jgi:branched-chain amino acid transport system permease protein
MNAAIALFLMQDGVINGAIYALLGVTLVLVFTVTRVIFVPQGEFVAWGALTLAAFEAGTTPGTAWLLLVLGIVTAVADVLRGEIARTPAALLQAGLRDVVLPAVLLGIAMWIAPQKPPLWIAALMTLALIVPMGPLVYRLAFAPMADASVLALFIAAIGVHFSLTGIGLLFFGAEGFRTTPFIAGVFPIGPLPFKGQSLVVLATTAILLVALWIFFERTLLGKALRATAVNRLGARLVGIPTIMTGRIAFALASAIGALSGMLVGSLTTIAYDSGFLIGLKGFVAAIAAGLASYPLTVIAAIAVGILESFSAFFASAFKEVIVFALIIPLLVWRSLAARHTDEEEE